MKKTIIFVISFLLPFITAGQVQINTKKVKIGDFTQKITKVVLTGNDFLDISLQEEIASRWRISPYEFCTIQEFENLKESEDYYFLLTTSGRFKKDSGPSIQFLTLVKGGKGAENGINGMLEVVSLPIASAKYPTGRELVFLPAFIDIIQTYTLDSMDNDYNAYGGLRNYTRNITKAQEMEIIFSEDDIDDSIIDLARQIYFDNKTYVVSEQEADYCLLANKGNALVSYVVAPTEPETGSICYKMLIDTQNHRLYYFKKHRISRKRGVGFTENDIRRIFNVRMKKGEEQ